MKARISLTDVGTGALLALALASAAMSIKMASAEEIAGTFDEGQALGARNGGLIAGRVYNKVIGNQGCDGLEQFQNALSTVVSNLRAPHGQGRKFIAGFYQGYVNAIGSAVHDARLECGAALFDDGTYPGMLFGAVVCQVAVLAPEAVGDLTFAPIYDGWSTSADVSAQCGAAFDAALGNCAATGIAAELLAADQTAACSI